MLSVRVVLRAHSQKNMFTSNITWVGTNCQHIMLCNIMLHFCHSLYYNNKLKFSSSEFLSSPYFIHDTSCIIDLTSTGCPWVPTSLQLKSLMTLTCQYSILQCIRSCRFIIIVTSATLSFFFSRAYFLEFYAFSALTLLVGHQEEHPACKNWLMGCWCGYLSGVMCRLFAYGLADATAISKLYHLLPYLNPDWFYLSGTCLSRFPG